MCYVRYPLCYRQVEDNLHERGIDICHETVRFWVERFGSKFAPEIRKKRVGHHSNWQWHLDEAQNLWQILQEKMRAKIEASIPNKKKLPYTLLVRPYRELILESLMEGKDIDLVFDDIIFEPIND